MRVDGAPEAHGVGVGAGFVGDVQAEEAGDVGAPGDERAAVDQAGGGIEPAGFMAQRVALVVVGDDALAAGGVDDRAHDHLPAAGRAEVEAHLLQHLVNGVVDRLGRRREIVTTAAQVGVMAGLVVGQRRQAVQQIHAARVVVGGLGRGAQHHAPLRGQVEVHPERRVAGQQVILDHRQRSGEVVFLNWRGNDVDVAVAVHTADDAELLDGRRWGCGWRGLGGERGVPVRE